MVADEPTIMDYHYSAVEAAERILELHKAMDVEPSETLCVHCSYRLPNGRFLGKTVEWPCPTVELLEDFWS